MILDLRSSLTQISLDLIAAADMKQKKKETNRIKSSKSDTASLLSQVIFFYWYFFSFTDNGVGGWTAIVSSLYFGRICVSAILGKEKSYKLLKSWMSNQLNS